MVVISQTGIELIAAKALPTLRVASTPFGAPVGSQKIYIGRAVAWKGFRKGERSFDDWLRDFIDKMAKIYDWDATKKANMERALRTIYKYATDDKYKVKGTSLVDIKGFKTILPRRAALIRKDAKKDVNIIRTIGKDIPAREWRKTEYPKSKYQLLTAVSTAVAAPIPG